MTTNDLPSWVPIFNIVVSVTALALAVPGLRTFGFIVVYRVALAVALVILIAGALFQANILPLWAWVAIGSGGRLVVLALIVIGTVTAWPGRRPLPNPIRHTTLDDLAAQLADIQRLTSAASNSAEKAHEAASAADDRVISQAERQVDDRARSLRIEDVSTDTNHRAMDIQDRITK